MAHKWDALSSTSGSSRRRCLRCDKEQTFECMHYDRMSGSTYRWTPNAGRCTVNAKPGRKPRTRDAILAAMDGPTTVKQIMERIGKTRGAMQTALGRMGEVRKVERGVWEKVENGKG